MQGLSKANELAAHFGALLVLVHVIPQALTSYEFGLEIPVPRAGDEEIECCRRMLRQVARNSVAVDVDIALVVRRGDVAGIVLETARNYHADLIVLGAHGARHNVLETLANMAEKLLIGSVAKRVLNESACPVLLVHEDHTKPHNPHTAPVESCNAEDDAISIARKPS